MDDDNIIAMAGAGTALVTYAALAGGVKAGSDIVEGAKKVMALMNPASLLLSNPWKKDQSWTPALPPLVGLSIIEIGAIGAAMCASAAIMWEMKHPYMGEAYEQFQKWQNERRDDSREAIKAIMERLPEIIESKGEATSGNIEAVGKVLPSLLMLAG